jgi:hypothetical protein
MSKKKGLTEEQKRKNLVTKISEMTPEQLRIACAERRGWREIEIFGDFSLGLHKIDSFPFEEFNEVPDYEHDRNSLQELIEAVPEDKREDFIDIMTTLIRERIDYKNSHDVPKLLYGFLTADPLTVMRAFLEVTE